MGLSRIGPAKVNRSVAAKPIRAEIAANLSMFEQSPETLVKR
jgi:hypothetical protein